MTIERVHYVFRGTVAQVTQLVDGKWKMLLAGSLGSFVFHDQPPYSPGDPIEIVLRPVPTAPTKEQT